MASASDATLAEAARPDTAEDPSEFPGCRPVRVTPADLDDYRGRFEYWDRDTETAFVVREPVSVYHEGPGQRLAALLALIAAVRGAPILTLGTADLALRDSRGERRRIMQADQLVYLDPAETQPRGPWVEVGSDHLPDVVLEVDYSTDVRRGKLGLYEAWGFPEVWVEVPVFGSPRRRPGLTIHRRSADGYRTAAASVALPGWTSAEIHAALNEPALSEATRAVLERGRPRARRGRRHQPRRRLVARRAARGRACAGSRGGTCAGSRGGTCAGSRGGTCAGWKNVRRSSARFCGAAVWPSPSAWPPALPAQTPPCSSPRRWRAATRWTCWPAWKRGRNRRGPGQDAGRHHGRRDPAWGVPRISSCGTPSQCVAHAETASRVPSRM